MCCELVSIDSAGTAKRRHKTVWVKGAKATDDMMNSTAWSSVASCYIRLVCDIIIESSITGGSKSLPSHHHSCGCISQESVRPHLGIQLVIIIISQMSPPSVASGRSTTYLSSTVLSALKDAVSKLTKD
jgi:hypothetical protein